MKVMKPTVCFDFDGVIHSYTSPWVSETVMPDPPVEGIGECLKKFCENNYKVVVYSTRCKKEAGVLAIKAYLKTYGMLDYVDEVTDAKPPAVAYIDDRGITFDGDPSTLFKKVENFKPWNR